MELKDYVRYNHINANDLHEKFQDAGWVKYSEFLDIVYAKMKIKRTLVERVLEESNLMHKVTFPRFATNGDYDQGISTLSQKTEWLPTLECIHKKYMDYRKPTITGHTTKWVSPEGYQVIVDLLEKYNHKESTVVKKKRQHKTKQTMWDYVNTFKDGEEKTIVIGIDPATAEVKVLSLGRRLEVPVETFIQQISNSKTYDYGDVKIIMCTLVERGQQV